MAEREFSTVRSTGYFARFGKYAVLLGLGLLVWLPVQAQAADWYSASWTARKKIAIDGSKISGGPHTDFPVLINLSTDTDLAADAQDDGDDLLFTSSDGVTKLSHEIEKFDGATGELVAWVKLPTLSTSSKVLYLYYGNGSATSQQAATAVWDSNYKGVWHVPNGTTLSATESTSNAFNGTISGATAAAGQIDGGASTDTSKYISVGDNSALRLTSGGTVSAWVKTTDATGTILSKIPNASPWAGWEFAIGTGGAAGRTTFWNGTAWVGANNTVNDGSWHHLSVTFDGTTTRFYRDGAADGTPSQGNPNSNTVTLYQGTRAASTDGSLLLTGTIDEPRISSVVRSAGWITTEYNNQSAPGTFYSVDPEEASAAPAWYNVSWAYRKKVTIDSQKVSGSHTNFPVLINFSSDSDLGADAQDDGDDLLFTSSNGTTKLDHEIEKFDGATGELVAWVEVPTLSSSENTVLYLYYGNASATNQQNATAVWDSNFKAVWHMKETSGTAIDDPTTNNNNGTKVAATEPNPLTGQIDGAQDFDGSNDKVSIADITPNLTQVTFSAWVNGDKFVYGPANHDIFSETSTSNCGTHYFRVFFQDDDTGTPEVYLSLYANSDVLYARRLQVWSLGTWYHIAAIYDSVSDVHSVFVNGVQYTNSVTAGAITNVAVDSAIGNNFNAVCNDGFDGRIDEVRISNIARSAGWIKTEYNNQSSPSTFTSVAAEEARVPGWYNTGWLYRKKITLDQTKVQGTHSNFPVLVSLGSDTDLAADAQDDGDDLLFTSADGTTKLSHEIEKFTGSTGELVAWVKVPVLSATADTFLYLYYGNATASSQQAATGTWDSNYKGVWHLKESPDGTSGEIKDSTSNANNGTSGGSMVAGDQVAAKIGGGLDFDGTDDRVQIPDSNNSLDVTNLTVSAWVYKRADAPSWAMAVQRQSGTGSSDLWLLFYYNNATDDYSVAINGTVQDGSSTGDVNTWVHLSGTMNGSTVTLYKNGGVIGTPVAASGNLAAETSNVCIAAGANDATRNCTSEFINAIMDEVRVSSVARSAGWIATEYNNQSSPSTFHTVGAEEAKAPGWYGTGWASRRQITIDRTKVVGTHTNFPFLVKFASDTDLAADAQDDGDDLLFTSADGTTKLSHEIEKFDGATGELIAWVKVPSLSSSANTVLYLYYGNSTAPSQQSATAVWDSNYKGVWHLKEDPSTTCSGTKETCDSTSLANHLDSGSAQAAGDRVTGKMGYGLDFDGTNDDTTNGSVSSLPDSDDAKTVSFWVSFPSVPGAAQQAVGLWGSGSTAVASGFHNLTGCSGISFGTWRWGGPWLACTAAPATSTWHHYTLTWDGTTNRMYLNGNQVTTSTQAPNASAATATMYLSVPGENFVGQLDEVRVSTGVRSASWIQTEYNNQSSSTFYSIETEEASAWYNANWAYRKKVTIDSQKVSGSHTNFPVLINLSTDTDLAADAQDDGDDLLFTSANGTTKLDHEIEKFDGATGELVAWVEVPNLSATADTVLYLYYGYGSATSQQNATGVWDSNFKGVWHLKENPTTTCSGTKEVCDSTSNANHGDSNGTQVAGDQQAAKVDGGLNFDGTDDKIAVPDAASLDTTTDLTLCSWVNGDTWSDNNETDRYVAKGANYHLRKDGAPSPDTLAFMWNDATTLWAIRSPNGLPANGTWTYLCGTATNDVATGLYVNGVLVSTTKVNAAASTRGLTDPFTIGAGDGFEYLDGKVDEVRMSNIVRSAGWITTEYNNQSSPATFYAVAAEEARAPGWYNAGWLYRKKITLDRTKMQGTHANFPVLISLSTDTDLAADAQDDGDDLLFTSADGTTKLSHEIEKFDGATGELVAWVKAPTVSATADTFLYLYYGNATAASQQAATAVWDSNYMAVWHLKENPTVACTGTKEVCDSTSNDKDGDSVNLESGDQIAGKISGALNFDGVNEYVSLPVSGFGPNNATISLWLRFTDTTTLRTVWGYKANAAATDKDYLTIYDGNGPQKIGFELRDSAGTTTGVQADSTYATGTWYKVDALCGSGGQTLYVNGVKQTATNASTFCWDDVGVGGTIEHNIARLPWQDPSTTFYFKGDVDELRLSSINRSAGWLATEYNNQSSPSTFHAVAAEEFNGLGWYGGWASRKAITIGKTKVSGTHTDFPFLVKLASDSDLAADAQDDGDDLVFTSADGATKLSHEIQSFNGTTGALVAWVKIPTLSSAADTALYLYYGNAGATSQQNATGVWDSSYKGVWHLEENPANAGASGIKDATSNAAHGTDGGSMDGNDQIAGQLGNALDFDGTDDEVSFGNLANANFGTNAFTVSFWMKTSTSDSKYMMGKNSPCNHGSWWNIEVNRTGAGHLSVELDQDAGGTNYQLFGAGTVNTGTWKYVSVTRSGATAYIYVDGVFGASGSTAGTTNISSSTTFYIGRDASCGFYPGALDEMRLSNGVARSAGWIQTEYNNQSSPGTFATLGTETAKNVFKMQTGYYVGTGATQSITGLGFQPQFVIVKADTEAGNGPVYKTSAMAANTTQYFMAAADSTNTLITLDADGFTVSSSVDVNTSGVRWVWMAFGGSDCTSTGSFCVGSYTGDGNATQAITTVGFQPDFVMVRGPTNSSTPVFRTSSMAANTSQYFASGLQADYFATLDATGFTARTGGNLYYTNNSGVTYQFIAFRKVAGGTTVGTYTGDGAASRAISGLGFSPKFVFLKQATVSGGVASFNLTESYGDHSGFFGDNNNGTNAIKALQADGFTAGDNSNTAVYYWVAFGGTADPAGSGTFKMAEGTYTGDGAGSMTIGVGFAPDLVLIKSTSTQAGVFRTRLMTQTAALGSNNGLFSDGITSLDSGGFTIGTNGWVNTAGVVFHWQAFGNASDPLDNAGAADFAIGAYTGNAVDDRGITRVPFQPDLVGLRVDYVYNARLRTSTMSGDATADFAATGLAANEIQALTSDGFQIGSSAFGINEAGRAHHWFAFKAGSNFAVGSYSGTGSAQNVTSVGFQPNLVWVRKNGTNAAMLRPGTLIGDATQYFSATANAADRITGFLSNGFSIGGNQVETNTSGATYYYAAWAGKSVNFSAYRLYTNADSTDVGAALASLNEPTALGSAGAAFRLRVLLHVNHVQLGASGETYKLQFAQMSGACDTTFAGETFADVTGATAIAFKNNATPADGATLTTNASDPTHGGDTKVTQTYEEANTFTNSVAAIPAGQDGLWDFALYDNGATAGVSYCLRVVESDGSILDSYVSIPGIVIAGRTNFSMQTGYYVGTGATQAITGLGFQPNLVLIKADTADGLGAVYKTSAMAANTTLYFTGTADDTSTQITLDANGFTVSSSANVNAAGVRWVWVAFGGSDCTSTGTFCVGSYTGDGQTSKALTSVGFQPDLVLVRGSGSGVTPVWRSSAMGANIAQYFTATGQEATGVVFKTLDATGFTVGNNSYVNTNLAAYQYIAFRASAGRLAVGTYVGNGADNRNIAGTGMTPDFLFMKSHQTRTPAFSVTEAYGDYTSDFTDAANFVNGVQALQTDGFQLGSHGSGNYATTDTYYYAAFGGAADPAPSGTFLMTEGSYTGNGTSQSVTGLGFKPDLVIIKKTSAGNDAVFATAVMPADKTESFDATGGAFAGGITSLDAGGFSVGSHDTVNANTATYHWQAFGNAFDPLTNAGAADFAIGAYTGSGIDSRNIVRTGLQPDFVVVRRTGLVQGVWRTSSHSGDLTSYFTSTIEGANLIQALNTDGFQVGTDALVNPAGTLQYWFAFKSGSRFAVGTYSGTGSAQNITSVGFQPDLVWVKYTGTGVYSVFRPSTLGTDTSLYHTEFGSVSDRITGFLSNGFSVGGSQNETNLSGTNNYRYAAWKYRITVSGTLYQTDESTTSASARAMKLAVGGATSYSTTSSAANGTWSFANVAANPSDVITVWVDTTAQSASLVFPYGSSCTSYPDCTGLSLYAKRVILSSKDGTTVTNATLAACDNDSGAACTDTDVGFTSNAGALTLTFVTTSVLRLKDAGVTFAPGGNVTATHFTQSNGTYTGGTEVLDLNDGDFTLTGGVFNGPAAPGGIFVERNVTVSGGTFNNAGKTLTVDGSQVADDTTIACSSLGGTVVIAKSGTNDAAVTVDTNCSISLGADPTTTLARDLLADLTNNGTITIASGTWTVANTTVNGTNAPNLINNGTITHNGTGWDINDVNFNNAATGTVTYAGTAITADRGFTQNGTLNLSGKTLTVDGDNASDDSPIACSGSLGGTLVITKSATGAATVSVGANCSVALGADPTTTLANGDLADLTNNGTITIASGTWAVANTTVNGASTPDIINNGTITHSGNGWDFDDAALTNNNGATITYSGTSITTDRSFTQNGTFNLSGKTLTINSGNNNDDVTIACSGSLGGTVVITRTSTGTATTTVDTGCSIALGADPVTQLSSDGTADLTNNGTITIASGTWTINNATADAAATPAVVNNGTITHNGTGWDLNDVSLNNAATGTITYSGTTITVDRTFRHNGTFDLTGKTVTLNDDSDADDDSSLACTPTFLGNLVINKTNAGATVTPLSSCTIAGTFTRTNGIVNDPAAAYTLTLQGDATISTSDAFGGPNLTLEFGGSANQLVSSAATISGPVKVNKTGGAASLNSALTLGSTLDIAAGTLDQGGGGGQGSGGNITTGGALTIGASGILRNTGSSDLTLAGDLTNNGQLILEGYNTGARESTSSGDGCGTSDTILLRSSLNGTQRAWGGTGKFLVADVDVQDQGGTASITAYSSTQGTGIGGNWTFSGCLTTALTQAVYRWYANADGVQPGAALANESQAYSLADVTTPVRLRVSLTAATQNLAAYGQMFALQWATSTSGPWTDVGTGDWVFKNNATPTDGTAVSSTLLTGSETAASYEEDNTTVPNPNAVTAGQEGEWDFPLDPANAHAGTTYYFRLVKGSGALSAGALDTYTVYPQAGSPQTTLTQSAYRLFANLDGAVFDTDGIVSSVSASDYAYDVARDGTYLYVAGQGIGGPGSLAHIEKRRLDTGVLDTGFDSDGYLTSSNQENGIRWKAVAVDSTSVYVAGYRLSAGADDWRIEKRSLTDGSLTWGKNGADADTAETAEGIAIDSTSMYVVGESSGSRIEKRALSTGNLDTSFDNDGFIVTGGTRHYDIAIDATYMYVVGHDATTWRIEKRRLDTGAVDTNFGTSGILTHADSTLNGAFAVAIDSTYMYVVGPNDDFANWQIEKRRLDTGALEYAVTSAANGAPADVAIDSTYMYVMGYGASLVWRIEKRRLDTGALETAFDGDGIVAGDSSTSLPEGIVLDATHLYAVGSETGNTFRIEKRFLSDGAIDKYTQVGSTLAAQDAAASLTKNGEAFRLRLLFHNGALKFNSSSYAFKLQYAVKSGTCADSSFADITAETEVAFYDNAVYTDGMALRADANDPTHSGHTIVNQSYEEANNFTASIAVVPPGQDSKWDFALSDGGGNGGVTYCLRAVKSDGSALNTYTVYPEITVAPRTPKGTGGGVSYPAIY